MKNDSVLFFGTSAKRTTSGGLDNAGGGHASDSDAQKVELVRWGASSDKNGGSCAVTTRLE